MIFKKLISILIVASIYSTTSATTSVWKISKGSDWIFLGGTVHVLRASDFPLPAAFNIAYQFTDSVWLETNLSGTKGPDFTHTLVSQLPYQDGTDLFDHLTNDAKNLIISYAKENKLQIENIQPYKPAMFLLTVLSIELQKIGATYNGVDSYFENRAVNDGKFIGKMESLEEHMDFIINMGMGYESLFIKHTIADLQNLESELDSIIKSWKTGDTTQMSKLLVHKMKTKTPQLYQDLLVQRNNNWMPKIEKLFSKDGKEFVLVGAAHMIGNEGLLIQLKNDGYQVEQLD